MTLWCVISGALLCFTRCAGGACFAGGACSAGGVDSVSSLIPFRCSRKVPMLWSLSDPDPSPSDILLVCMRSPLQSVCDLHKRKQDGIGMAAFVCLKTGVIVHHPLLHMAYVYFCTCTITSAIQRLRTTCWQLWRLQSGCWC